MRIVNNRRKTVPDGLFQSGLPARQLGYILQRLKKQRVMPERNKETLLRNYLSELGVILPSGNHQWQLVDASRLELLLNIVQQQLQQQVTGSKNPAILRRLEHVHHKSASAWRGNSKSGQEQPLSKGQIITHDEVLRIRSQGTGMELIFIQNGRENYLYPDEDSILRSECCLPERLLLNVKSVNLSSVRLIMTVENLGAYVDMPLVDGLILVFSPGQNFSQACKWIRRFGQNITWIHFPDLDPNGLKIAQQIAQALSRPCHIWLPQFWPTAHQVNDLVGASKLEWIQAPDCPQLAALVQEQRWIEQETLVLDYRFCAAIQRLVEYPELETTKL
ncbi:Wadjet anti-phage system protein JetD domain-containing protein [Photorhabdus bodei]|uniref:Wadjet protein JetD C-terminal domain-containing protein n=1 Tax=Photorhabdus aegyptia TaxID=2805098 RepID=A0A022PIM6_9GAMM|nr:Wadjet anti-phage system protein JetD domain-containing protein [Photorhabdus aegyptia]EYU15486.1 hypothetical protein BA1DRAFT_01929 [Photorhabdus aegyptia]